MTGLFQTIRSTFVSRTGSTAVELGTVLVLARLLTPAAFGTFVLYQGMVVLFGVLTDAGITNATTKRISGREEPASNILGTALTLKIIAVVVVSVGVLMLRSQLNVYFGASVALFVIPGVAGYQFGRLGVRVLHGELNVARGERIDLYRRIVFAVVSLGGVWMGFGLEAALAGYILSWGVVIFTTTLSIRTGLGFPSQDLAWSLFGFGKYDFIASSVGASLYSWTDTLLIGVFLSSTAVGAYELAWRLSAGTLLLARAIGLSLFPQVSNWTTTTAIEKLESTFPDAFLGSLVLVLPAIVGTVIIGNSLLSVIRPEFTIAYVAFVVLTIGRGFQAVNAITTRSLYGMDKPEYPALAAVIFLCANLVLNAVFIPWLGLFGAASATVFAFSLNTAINWWALSREIKLKIPTTQLGVTLVASIVMGAGLFLITPVFESNRAIPVAMKIILGGVIYATTIFMFQPIREQMFKAIKIK